MSRSTVITTVEISTYGSYCGDIELDSEKVDEEDAEMSVKDQILRQVARVIGLKKKTTEVENKPCASKCNYCQSSFVVSLCRFGILCHSK